jgi:hypothetical protein
MVGMLAGNGHAVLVNVGKVSLGIPQKNSSFKFWLKFRSHFPRKPFVFADLGGLYRSLSPWFSLIEKLYVVCFFDFVEANRAFG